MKNKPKILNVAILVLILIASGNLAMSQNVSFIDIDTIIEKYPEAQQALQSVENLTNEWKRELDSLRQNIFNLGLEIEENSLIWTEDEIRNKEREYSSLKKVRDDYTKTIFEPGGKFDQAVKTFLKPIEEKIKINQEN